MLEIRRKEKKQIHELEIEPGGGGVGVVMHHQTTKDSRISFGEFGGGEKERERGKSEGVVGTYLETTPSASP